VDLSDSLREAFNFPILLLYRSIQDGWENGVGFDWAHMDSCENMFLHDTLGERIQTQFDSKYIGGADFQQPALSDSLYHWITTMPELHSGKGLFFTSKCGMSFIYQLMLWGLNSTMNQRAYYLVRKRTKGTFVKFTISRRSRTDLTEIFHSFSPEEYDYSFERSEILLVLCSESLHSRSLAKRILTGLSAFREVILDFNGITTLDRPLQMKYSVYFS